MQDQLIATRAPRGAYWQLGSLPPQAGHLLLIGWCLPRLSAGDGVPPSLVTNALARALVSVATVSFLASTVVTGAHDKQHALGTGGIAEYIRSRWMHAPTHATLLSTSDAQSAAQLFDDDGYPWHLQGQVALLSAADADIASLNRKAVLALIEPDWMTSAAALASRGIRGVLRPGVDGAVVGILCLNNTFEQALVAALQRESQSAGLDWTLLSEDAFAQALRHTS
ncbi:hypothetical protein ACS7SF_12505 [Ralstonia sp. 25C]|uniref:hypothetical protein n=1 Tax=Ralstonia sp. 25C TaxID=3447363 RepID=UPI003F7568EB